LQPRGVKPTEGRSARNTEQTVPLKIKKVVGKIRVEGNLAISTDFSHSNTMNVNGIIIDIFNTFLFVIDIF